MNPQPVSLALTHMRDFFLLGGIFAVWLILQAVILPRLGVKT